MPPSLGCRSEPDGTVFIVTSPPTGFAPSATQTMLNRLPARSRSMILSHTLSMSNGISGMRITSAVPATPLNRAIHPAVAPITSTTNTRP
jgi:hypothetical protein